MNRMLTLAAAAALTFGGVRGAGGQVPKAAVVQRSAAAESTLDARTKDLAAQLRCPVCQGLSIQDSPSELSQQMRAIVKQQLADGKSPDEIKSYFVARYGEWILMAPEAHGFNWLVYTLPFVMLGVGGWILMLALRRWRTPSTLSSAPVPPSGGPGTAL